MFLPSSATTQSERYVTLKVRIDDEEAMQWALFALTDSQGLLTDLEDIFFRVPSGQLKLRLAHPGKDIGTLISLRQTSYSHRPDFFESRSSEVQGARQLWHTLSLALEQLAVLHKKRRTFTMGSNVKLHLDSVEGLGSFLDIEIHPSSETEPEEKVLARADELLAQLCLSSASLVPFSYLELFLREREKRDESDESAFSDESMP